MPTGQLLNVALVSVGSWNAAAGSGEVSSADLDATVEAYADKLVDRPMVKIGHEDDNVFNDELKDGEPAYGWIENVTRGAASTPLRPDPATLYGDLVGMPPKLAEIAPAAFRRRSVELLRQVTTSAGKSYKAVLSAVALLGLAKPAVKGLDDVLALYADGTGAASLTVLELMDGLAAEQVSTFAAVLADLAPVHNTGVIPPRTDHRPDSGDDAQQGKKPADKETKMPGLTKEQVLAALDAEGDKSIEDRLAELTTVEETDEEKAARETAEAAAAQKVIDDQAAADAAAAAAAGGGDEGKAPETVTLSAAQFAALSDGANKGTEVAKILDAQRRDKIANDAFAAGKITKTELTEWRKALDRDEAGITSLLSTLTARFSVQELGDDAAPTELAEGEAKAVDTWLDTVFGAAPKS